MLSLDVGPVITLDYTDGLDALHAALLGELGELDKREDLAAAIRRFQAGSVRERADELARLLAGAAEGNVAPIIVDNGVLLKADGQYVEEVLQVFDALREHRDTYIAVVHARKPVVDRGRLEALHATYFRIPPIELQATALLTSQALRRAGILATVNEINEFSQYMDGYPPAVYLAVSLIREYDVATILADKSMLVDFRIRTFSQLLPKLHLTERDWECLRVLASEPILPFEALSAVLNLDGAETAAQVRRLIDLNLISPRQRNFQIASPVREAVFVARGRLTDGEFGRVAAALEETFWRDKTELPPIDIVSATVHAVSRSNSSRLTEFGGIILPSVLFKAAKEKYDQGGPDAWAAANALTERVLEVDPKHRGARKLRFRILVRLGEWDSAERILRDIAATGDLEQHYLRGFMQWKRNQFENAIDSFRGALRVGHTSVAVYHGLATCQYRRGWADAALDTVREGIKQRRPNKYLLDLGVQVAVEVEHYAEAAKYLEDLRRLGDDAGYHHRAARLLSAQGQFRDALEHADRAVETEHTRFEVLAARIDILIELEEFDRAASDLDELDTRFRAVASTNDVRTGLRCKLLLREQRWLLAEQVLGYIQNRNTPQYRALRIEILTQKSKDPSASPGVREAALTEIGQLSQIQTKRGLVVETYADGEEEPDEDDGEVKQDA